MLYYEPIEDGDVRMVSLNYVKADDQSLYQTGQADGANAPPDNEQQAAKIPLQMIMNAVYVQAKLKGGKQWRAY